MTSTKVVLPSLLFLVPVLILLMTAQPVAVVMAGSNDDDENRIAVGEPNPSGPIPVEPDQGPGGGGGGVGTCDPDDDQCGTPYPGGPPNPPLQIPSGRNLAEANQVGGLGSGNVEQNAQGAVNEQYCRTIGGIGDRRCAQYANPEGQNLQDCAALAGLGKANCVQSESGGGTGTCLSANGRPYICQTDTGVAISGSGQAGQ